MVIRHATRSRAHRVSTDAAPSLLAHTNIRAVDIRRDAKKYACSRDFGAKERRVERVHWQ